MGSNSSSTASTVFMIVIVALVVLILIGVGITRYRRSRTTGSPQDPVRSREHAREIADRLHSLASSQRSASTARVEVQGAALLQKELSDDDRFSVAAAASGGDHWTLTVSPAPDGAASGGSDDELGREAAKVLERNGITASAAGDHR